MSELDAWKPVLSDVEVFRDSCNVYAIRGDEGTIFVNSGTGLWIDSTADKFPPPYSLLCTHYFRDHAAGAARASQFGMKVFVPEAELEMFADPDQHFRSLQNYVVYDNIWENFSPITPAKVKAALDYDTLDLAGLQIAVLPLPGVTPNHCGYFALTPHSNRRVVFCGEAIHSPGRMARIAPLQYNYNDLGGAVNAYFSATELRRLAPDALLPSLGHPILSKIDDALFSLQNNLKALCRARPAEEALMDIIVQDDLHQISEHVFMSTHTEAISYYLVSNTGKVLVIDYGYRGAFGVHTSPDYSTMWHWPSVGSRSRRRVLLHGLELLQKNFNIDRIDVVLLSHFHDDHIAGVPLLQRLFNIECWVPSNFAELVEHPEYHRFPCGWPQPVRVDRRLSLQQPFEWENFRFQLAPMSGHTRFSSAFLFEADGLRFAHVGDQFFAMDLGDPARPTLQQNHVYRNGASTESYKKTAALMKSWRPNIILTGHRWPYHTSEAFFERLDEGGDQFKQMHQSVMVLGEDEIHFGLDSWGGWIWPYRFHLNQGEAATARVTVRNPVPEEAALTVRLVGPEGWQGSSKIVQARPRQEISCELSIWPPGPCRRQPITAELLIGNRTFGHVAEALVTVGGTCF